MPERIDVLDRIDVAEPCRADWDEMAGNEQVRFCLHCSKHVHDLSKITRNDVRKLVAASGGSLCVRYQKRPDGTLKTAERAEPLTQIKRRLSRIAAGAFTASLSLAQSVAAQTPRPAGGERPPRGSVGDARAHPVQTRRGRAEGVAHRQRLRPAAVARAGRDGRAD